MKIRSACIAAAMLASGGVASAEVIIHVNDGTFDWVPSAGGFFGSGLDITKDANQSGDITANTFEWYAVDPPSSKGVGSAEAYASEGTNRMMMEPVAPGEMIGPASDFGVAIGLYTYTFANFPLTWLGPTPNLGVKIELDGQEHYGWISMQWVGNRYDPIAWAYETEPGVPIMATSIPAPASLAPLAAFGALAMRRRR